jgi:hypothetical protein
MFQAFHSQKFGYRFFTQAVLPSLVISALLKSINISVKTWMETNAIPPLAKGFSPIPQPQPAHRRPILRFQSPLPIAPLRPIQLRFARSAESTSHDQKGTKLSKFKQRWARRRSVSVDGRKNGRVQEQKGTERQPSVPHKDERSA